MAWSLTRVSPKPGPAWPASATGADPQTPGPDADRAGTLLPGATANRGLIVRVGDTVVRTGQGIKWCIRPRLPD